MNTLPDDLWSILTDPDRRVAAFLGDLTCSSRMINQHDFINGFQPYSVISSAEIKWGGVIQNTGADTEQIDRDIEQTEELDEFLSEFVIV